MDRPPPVRDLDWDPARAEAFAAEMVAIWKELLGSLRAGPVVPPHLTEQQVREGVALDVPDEPLPTDRLVAHLRVEEHPEFELLATGLSICCFRYRPQGVDDEETLNRMNERLVTELQVDGRAYPSNAIVDGRFCLRTCIVNFRTEAEDLDRLLEIAAELGARIQDGLSSTLPS